MKAYFIFAICLVAASAVHGEDNLEFTAEDLKELEEIGKSLSDSSSEVRKTVQQCLEGYNISKHIVVPSNDDKAIEDYLKLNDEQQNCVLYCSRYGLGWVKDGAFDVDKLAKDLTPERKTQFAKDVAQCRVEHPENNCLYMKCVDDKY